MSESAECPYCGQTVHTQREVDYDNKIKLRCNSCGGIFEYMPGFGSFSVPDQDRRESVRYHETTDYDQSGVYGGEAPWTVERPAAQGTGCGKACIVLCLLCFFLPIISIFIFFFEIFAILF
jgi:hypothetical protein